MPLPLSAKATLTPYSNGTSGTAVPVHFNPATLTYTVTSTVSQKAGAPKTAQFVASFSGELAMDLQFDTTATGSDVRQFTDQVALFMQPSGTATAAASTGNSTGLPPKVPPVLTFQWGTYTFQGVMKSFRETIDFFSAEGVALRALVSITLGRQDNVFDENASFSSATTTGSLVPAGAGTSASSAAAQGGDPSAARALGSDNGLESLRSGAGASLQVGGGVQLNAAAGFSVGVSAGASGGLGISGGAGISAGVGVSAGAGISGGIGISAGVGVSAGVQLSAQGGGGALFGATASAGVPATAGAFAGLEVGRATISTTSKLDPSLMLTSTIGSDVSTSAGASFSLGGAANSTSGAGLSADVGATASLGAGLSFDGD